MTAQKINNVVVDGKNRLIVVEWLTPLQHLPDGQARSQKETTIIDIDV